MEVLHQENPSFHHQIPRLVEKSGSDGLVGHQQVKGLGQTVGHQLAKWTRRLDLADRAVLRVAGE